MRSLTISIWFSSTAVCNGNLLSLSLKLTLAPNFISHETFFKFPLKTASQNSFGLHERVIRDQAIFYTGSAAMLDTAQRIISNESEPVDNLSITTIPKALAMQIGESISVNDAELEVAGTYRIMGQVTDMHKHQITFRADNSQLILADAFTLDTSSLGGTDILV